MPPPVDLFISHASDDKDAVARPLALTLRARGLSVWFDEFELTMGDSLRREIDRGLADARYGVVILSPAFFAKEWPQRELDGLNAREVGAAPGKIILPVWHEVDHAFVASYSPPLADRLAISSDRGVEVIADEIVRVLQKPSATPSARSAAARTPAAPASRIHARGRRTQMRRWLLPVFAVAAIGAGWLAVSALGGGESPKSGNTGTSTSQVQLPATAFDGIRLVVYSYPPGSDVPASGAIGQDYRLSICAFGIDNDSVAYFADHGYSVKLNDDRGFAATFKRSGGLEATSTGDQKNTPAIDAANGDSCYRFDVPDEAGTWRLSLDIARGSDVIFSKRVNATVSD